ncbi:DinB family protein [Eubacteriales bacterium OttesenSCG-928-K08]|nr:DinB family protein [Eubacteriales bacterium OttesenSCG-928-K08]MDL2288612.1 DinB family protein [Oscillospiraceae bacterium OttesenSCG-928-F05]MDL2300087.1 DinB family protein [Clostridiaceae bacterium OttesenSCG-928-D20]
MSWSLLDFHLSNLDDAECLWRPSEKGLTVLKHGSTWYSDWPESEGYEIGPANIAWITWHILFWWSMANDYSFGNAVLKKEDIHWPGDIAKVKEEINNLRDVWVDGLCNLPDKELFDSKRTRWPFIDKPFYDVASWLNVELMKNASEIGYCRFLYASQH